MEFKLASVLLATAKRQMDYVYLDFKFLFFLSRFLDRGYVTLLLNMCTSNKTLEVYFMSPQVPPPFFSPSLHQTRQKKKNVYS
jgi:hypothetical protein